MIRAYLAPVKDAQAGVLNAQELIRIAVVALYAGILVFSFCFGAKIPFPAPSDAALAAFVLTIILETLRRLPHG